MLEHSWTTTSKIFQKTQLSNFFFSFLSSQPQPEPPTTTRRPTAWLSSQICNHRGHAVKHGPRWFWVALSSDFREARTTAAATTRRPTAWLSGQICNHRGHAVKHGPRWFLVVLQPRFPVLFRCLDLHGSNDDPNGLEAAPRWFLVVGCSDQFGGFWLFKFPVVFGSNLHGSN